MIVLKGKTGNIILLAIGFLSLLGLLALSTNFETALRQRKAISKIARAEGFYSAEYSAWHAYEKNKISITETQQPDSKGRYPASFEANYDVGIDSLTEDNYDALKYESGLALGLKTTLNFDSARMVIRRYGVVKLKYRPRDPQGATCGLASSEKSDFKSCLWASVKNPPPIPSSNRLAATPSSTCYILQDGTVKCWGHLLTKDSGIGPGYDASGRVSFIPIPFLSFKSAVSAFVAGSDNYCVLIEGGVSCWGVNMNWVLGNCSMLTSTKNMPIVDLSTGVTAISLSEGGSGWEYDRWITFTGRGAWGCAIQEGVAKCWGGGRPYYADGKYKGDGLDESAENEARSVAVPGLPTGVTQLSVGLNVACAVVKGAVWCWGGDFQRLPGAGSHFSPTKHSGGSKEPRQITGLTSSVTEVSVGAFHACALVEGRVKCWGNNRFGQIGQDPNTVSSSEEPKLVAGLSDASKLTLRSDTSCANVKGEIYCWGSRPGVGAGSIPSKIEKMPPEIKEFVVTVGNIFGLLPNEKIYGLGACLGLAIATKAASCATFKAVLFRSVYESEYFVEYLPAGKTFQNLKPVSHLSLGKDHTCALLKEGGARCWGGNSKGELGNNSDKSFATHVKVDVLSSISAIAAGTGFTCAVESGFVKCWGLNSRGQIGVAPPNTDSKTPVTVSNISDVTQIVAGEEYACAITGSGTLKCWGRNTYGQLGNNTNTDSHSAVQVEGLTSNVTAVSLFRDHTCAIVSGAVKCWGKNEKGQLGNNTTMDSLVPVQVEGLTSGATSVAVGEVRSCAVVDGAAKCWGLSHLGNQSTNESKVPVQVETLESGVSSVVAGHGNICALVKGSVKCWGEGAMGNNENDGSLLPRDVFYLPPNATFVAAGPSHVCALVTERIYCWGQDGPIWDGILGRVGNRIELGNGGIVMAPILVPIVE